MADLLKRLDRISAPDVSAGVDAQRWLDQLTKPPGSLGRLEELARRLAEITGICPPRVEHPVIFTLAGDHGVVEERVSAYPPVVTAQMVENFLRGGAAINVLARHAGARVVVADLGVDADLPDDPHLRMLKVRRGTENITRGPAMTVAEAVRAIDAGRGLVRDELRGGEGMDIAITGDMGIGNTTASAGLICALTGLDPGQVVGRGTGLDDARLERKVIAVRQALRVNASSIPKSPLDTLAA